MQIIKSLFSRVTAVWSLYGYVTRINAALKSRPGTDDEIRLRAWLLDNLALLAGLATKTVNPVDDAVVFYTIRIIENDTAWKVLYNMLSLAGGVRNMLINDENTAQIEQPVNPEITQNNSPGAVFFDSVATCHTVPSGGIGSLYEIENALKTDAGASVENNDAQETGNPLLIISAVGLILQIIQYLRNR